MLDSRAHSVKTLAPLEALVLWTIRAWVLGHCHGRDATTGIRNVYTQLGVSEAAISLEEFMRALAAGTRRSLEIHCTCHTDVSDDERRLLRVMALEQDEAPDDAYALFAALLTEAEAATASASACRLVFDLEAAGHVFSAQTLRGPNAEAQSGLAHVIRHMGYLH